MSHSTPTYWLNELWPRVTAASGIGYLVVAYAVSRWLTRRSQAVVPLPTHLAAVEIESFACVTTDGIQLRGWAIEPKTPRATVALFHGMRANRTQLLERIGFLTAAGYRCVAFDLRAHGESGGHAISFGYHERHDVVAVADLIASRWPKEPRAVLGVSMGGASVCFAGAAAREFDAIILESVYHDLFSAFQHRVGAGYPAWFRHFRRGVIWLTERRLGARIADVAPIAHIEQLAPRPVLLLTGSDDLHAPPHEVQALAERVGATGRFCLIPGAGHDDVCERGGEVYREAVLTFFENHLFRRRHPAAA